jgi:hypothetical protein
MPFLLMNWRQHAICKGHTHLFFSHKPKEQKRAGRLCEQCPVTGACAQEAFNIAQHHEVAGIWGGTTQNYREQLVGQNRRQWGTT